MKKNTIVGKLYEHFLTQPDSIALIDQQNKYTYLQFVQYVLSISGYLNSLGVKPGQAVAICADNSSQYVIIAYSIMYMGGVFVPLPSRDPDMRIQALGEQAKIAYVFTDRSRSLGDNLPAIDIANLFASLSLETPDWNYVAPEPDNLAYIMFTSGSTGAPKGVCISAGSFYFAAQQAAEIMGFSSSTVSLLILPLHFDGSFSSVFSILLSGGSVFINRGSMCLPKTFFAIMKEFKVAHTSLTPTYLKALIDSDGFSNESCKTWDTVAIGGEHPRKTDLLKVMTKQPGIKFFNRYGPTEATMAVSTFELSRAILESDMPLPIGTAHQGVSFYAVNEQGQAISEGEQAELCIGGRQLMIGYLGGTQDEVFINNYHTGERLLRTGDLVTINNRGEYIVLERVDNIIKRFGTRVALSEIENALRRIEPIEEVACISDKSAECVKIVAFIKVKSDVTEKTIRRELLKSVPTYMNPDSIRFVTDFPLAAGGKLDRKYLHSLI